MQLTIDYRGHPVGTLTIDAKQGLSFHAVCTCHTERILRLYGIWNGKSIRIGVLEPGAQYLTLQRHWTTQTMRSLDIQGFPQSCYLDDGLSDCFPSSTELETASQTSCSPVKATSQIDDCLSAPFIPGASCSLAYALTACVIHEQNGKKTAVLHTQNNGFQSSII